MTAPLEGYDAEIRARIDELWQTIVEKKGEVLELVQRYDAISQFISDYDHYFSQYEQDRRKLVQQIRELERLIMREESTGEAFENLLKPVEEAPEPEPEPDVMDAAAPEGAAPAIELEDDFFGDDFFGDEADDEPETPAPELPNPETPPPTAHASRKERKRRVAAPFRNMYQPRVHDLDAPEYTFRNARMADLNALLSDDDQDEFEFIARLPFDEQDRQMWYNPHFGALRPTDPDAQAAARLYLFGLWAALLTEAVRRESEKVRLMTDEDMLAEYDRWQASPLKDNLGFYLQSLESQKQAELDKLRARIAELS